jgi:hypothetical protein
VFTLRIDDDEGIGQAVHVPDALQVPANLEQFAVQRGDFLLGLHEANRCGFWSLREVQFASVRHHRLNVNLHVVAGGVIAFGQPFTFEFAEAVQPGANRTEVREGTPQPALRDVRHARPASFALDDFLSLALGANEQHELPPAHDLIQVAVRAKQVADGFAEVDDVNEVAFSVNIRPHFRVPTARPVSVVDARIEQILDVDEWFLLQISQDSTPVTRVLRGV